MCVAASPYMPDMTQICPWLFPGASLPASALAMDAAPPALPAGPRAAGAAAGTASAAVSCAPAASVASAAAAAEMDSGPPSGLDLGLDIRMEELLGGEDSEAWMDDLPFLVAGLTGDDADLAAALAGADGGHLLAPGAPPFGGL